MTEQQKQQQFALQRIYVKDLSFESPQTPTVFKKEWKPQVNLELNTKNNKLEDDHYEVVLTLTITAKIADEVAFLVELQQAGIFMVKNVPEAQLRQILGAMCPNILFPYAREAVDNTVLRGSFPPLMLAPVNFDALYQQALLQQEGQKGQNVQ